MYEQANLFESILNDDRFMDYNSSIIQFKYSYLILIISHKN